MKRFIFLIALFVTMPVIADDTVCPTGYSPYGYYIMLEYIESNGTQWLDTGIIQKSAPKITVTFKPLGVGDVTYFGNLFTGSGCVSFNFAISSAIWYVRYGMSSTVSATWKTDKSCTNFANTLKDGDFHELVLTDNQDMYLDGDIWATVGSTQASTWTQNTQSIYIGKGHYGAGSAQFKDFKIEENGVLKYHGIPVVDALTGKVGMYDLVSRTFTSSATSTEFIAGPEITTYKSEKCFPCPANTYKPNAGNEECTPCPDHTFSPVGSTSLSECAKILHVGGYVVYMPVGKRTEHGLCTMLDGKKYCADVYERQ